MHLGLAGGLKACLRIVALVVVVALQGDGRTVHGERLGVEGAGDGYLSAGCDLEELRSALLAPDRKRPIDTGDARVGRAQRGGAGDRKVPQNRKVARRLADRLLLR